KTVVILAVAGLRRQRCGRQIGARTESSQTRVDEHHATLLAARLTRLGRKMKRVQRPLAEIETDDERILLGQCYLGAQCVERQPAEQIGAPARFAFDEQAIAVDRDEEVMQIL